VNALLGPTYVVRFGNPYVYPVEPPPDRERRSVLRRVRSAVIDLYLGRFQRYRRRVGGRWWTVWRYAPDSIVMREYWVHEDSFTRVPTDLPEEDHRIRMPRARLVSGTAGTEGSAVTPGNERGSDPLGMFLESYEEYLDGRREYHELPPRIR
jgi:hypothetical protein